MPELDNENGAISNQQIIPAELVDPTPPEVNIKDLVEIMNDAGQVTKDRADALAVISSGKVPAYAIREHPGKAGEIFKYVDHVWITKTLRNAFGPAVNFNAMEATLESDGTATGKANISLEIQRKDGTIFRYSVTEFGACNTTRGMTLADRKLSAISKAFSRCAFRGFGIGQEFYKTTDMRSQTDDEAWEKIDIQIRTNKRFITQEEVIEFCKTNKIAKNEIAKRFDDIWQFVGDTIRKNKVKTKGE